MSDVKTPNDLVAAEIRAEQGRQRISGRELARAIGKPESTVARWLRGRTAMSLDEIELFAQALNLTVVDLVSRAYAGNDNGPADGPGRSVVRRQGLEPRTRWLRAACPVVPLPVVSGEPIAA